MNGLSSQLEVGIYSIETRPVDSGSNMNDYQRVSPLRLRGVSEGPDDEFVALLRTIKDVKRTTDRSPTRLSTL